MTFYASVGFVKWLYNFYCVCMNLSHALYVCLIRIVGFVQFSKKCIMLCVYDVSSVRELLMCMYDCLMCVV